MATKTDYRLAGTLGGYHGWRRGHFVYSGLFERYFVPGARCVGFQKGDKVTFDIDERGNATNLQLANGRR
jgi:hypothetical protein